MKQMGLELELREHTERSELPEVLKEQESRQLVALLAAAIIAVFRQEKEVRHDHADARPS